METSTVPPSFGTSFDNPINSGFASNGDVDIDMQDEMDIDLTADPGAYAADEGALENGFTTDIAVQEDLQPFDDSNTVEVEATPEKVFIRGLDDLTTEDLERYISECFASGKFVKVQWINDHSAKFVYEDADAASQALAGLTDDSQVDPLSLQPREERRAKPLSWRDAKHALFVRQATVNDVKVRNAGEQSRFYLFNPDKDPREQRRQEKEAKRNGGGDERGDYKRRRFDDREHRRRRDGGERFDVSMYDDDAGDSALSSRPHSEDRRRPPRRQRRGSGDLFGDKANGRLGGRLRNRSASPLRDGDGTMGFEDDQPRRRTARQRSSTPEHLRRPVERNYAQSNAGKELFSTSKPAAGLSHTDGPVKELFPEKSTPLRSPKELFPNRTSMSHHRRTPAIDASDETSPASFKARSLADRITGGPRSSLHGRPPSAADEESFDIRGAAQSDINIRGAAVDASTVARELFPLKAGTNAGKELFGEKIKGRGLARRRAEDMF